MSCLRRKSLRTDNISPNDDDLEFFTRLSRLLWKWSVFETELKGKFLSENPLAKIWMQKTKIVKMITNLRSILNKTNLTKEIHERSKFRHFQVGKKDYSASTLILALFISVTISGVVRKDNQFFHSDTFNLVN